DDSESLTGKSKSAESDEKFQTVEEIVDDSTECQNVVMDDDVLSTKDEVESVREFEQQLETDDLIVEDVSESL
nr:hypothetical protein CTI12_AA212160 [Tanacetum cinerariifolium]